MFKIRFVLIPIAALSLVSSTLLAAPRFVRPVARPGAATGTVTLPYQVSDSAGNRWFIYQGGQVQQQGPMPIYQQAAMLLIEGNQIQQGNNQARIDDRSGEIILENMSTNTPGLTVARRIALDPKESFIRYIDIFHNGSGQEISINVTVQTSVNYGVTAAEFLTEPGGKQRQIGWVANTPAGKAVAELFAGKGAKVAPTINWQQNNNFVGGQYQLVIPANKDVAIMHLHLVTSSTDVGTQTMMSMKESKLLANVPPEVRRAIVNFAPGSAYIGDREILRGDSTDVIELRAGATAHGGDTNVSSGGDQIKGTIKDQKFRLTTFYGTIELPASKLLGIINVGQFRPRQLLVSTDGEVFGGKIEQESISLELASGQTTQIPIGQISRIGWRKGPSESDDPTTQPDRPMLLLRTGDRFAVALAEQPVEVATRYGLLKIAPATIASILFASEDVGVHQIFLTDGTHFAGLVSGDQFQFKMIGGAGGQTVSIPASSLARLQIVADEVDPDDSAPRLQLSNDDLFVGALAGQLKLDTAFDTIALNAPELRSLSRTKEAGANTDVQIELWDQSHLSGQLEEQELTCALASGMTIHIPLMMVDRYTQPLPQPSAAMIDRIKQLVHDLGVDDWKQREKAESQLTAMGNSVVSIMKPMRAEANPEAQQRIDSIIQKLDVKKKKSPGISTDGAPPSDD